MPGISQGHFRTMDSTSYKQTRNQRINLWPRVLSHVRITLGLLILLSRHVSSLPCLYCMYTEIHINKHVITHQACNNFWSMCNRDFKRRNIKMFENTVLDLENNTKQISTFPLNIPHMDANAECCWPITDHLFCALFRLLDVRAFHQLAVIEVWRISQIIPQK